MNRHSLRCASVASSTRGNHARGADNSRPSARMTFSRSSVTVTSIAVASTLMAEMGIPGLFESYAILNQERPQTVDFRRPKAVGLRKTNRLQPELRDVVTVFKIYVRRFGSLEAIKKEPETRYSQHSRHGLPQNIRISAAAHQRSYIKCPTALKSS